MEYLYMLADEWERDETDRRDSDYGDDENYIMSEVGK